MKKLATTPITRQFLRALELVKSRGWENFYILVDLHGTVIKPNWSNTELPETYYEYCLETLRILTSIPNMKLILWTSSHKRDYDVYRERLKVYGVEFDYVNDNPEVDTDNEGFGNFDLKPYFNLGLDDKFGFEPDFDWYPLWNFSKALRP